jgi:hypothetical protein
LAKRNEKRNLDQTILRRVLSTCQSSSQVSISIKFNFLHFCFERKIWFPFPKRNQGKQNKYRSCAIWQIWSLMGGFIFKSLKWVQKCRKILNLHSKCIHSYILLKVKLTKMPLIIQNGKFVALIFILSFPYLQNSTFTTTTISLRTFFIASRTILKAFYMLYLFSSLSRWPPLSHFKLLTLL